MTETSSKHKTLFICFLRVKKRRSSFLCHFHIITKTPENQDAHRRKHKDFNVTNQAYIFVRFSTLNISILQYSFHFTKPL